MVEQASDPLIGKNVDRYEVIDRLGSGAMGCVYRARHTRLDRDFAIKVLFGEMASNKKVAARFHREAKAASRMSHPNVVSVLDFGTTENGLTFLAMDLIDGRSLADAITAEAPFETARVMAMMREIASGLAEAHSLGFVHRDLKPANIMLDPQADGEHPKILDFGLVAMAEEPGGASKLTRTGYTLGTPAYMAPEQAKGEKVGPAADLYALGSIGYEMVTGNAPYDGPIASVMVLKLAQMPPPFQSDGPIEQLIWSLLSIEPVHRPPSAMSVIAAIEEMEGGRRPSAGGLIRPRAGAPSGQTVAPSHESAVAATAVRTPAVSPEASPMTPILVNSAPQVAAQPMASLATHPERGATGADLAGGSSSSRGWALKVAVAVALIAGGIAAGELLVPRGDTRLGAAPGTPSVAGAPAVAGSEVVPSKGEPSPVVPAPAIEQPAARTSERAPAAAPAAPPEERKPVAAIIAERNDTKPKAQRAQPVAKKPTGTRQRAAPKKRAAPPQPKAPAAKAEPRSYERWEQSIVSEATRRGLTQADLRMLPGVGTKSAEWRKSRDAMSEAASAQLVEPILADIRNAKITPSILNEKLDGVAKSLDRARKKAPADVYQRLENSYLDLSAEVRPGLSDPQSETLAKRVTQLAGKVAAAAR